VAEPPNANDQAERLRRLQERRAASGRPTRTPQAGDGSAPASPQARARRKHPAAATRVFLAGLSVTSFFAVGGAIAVANRAAQTTRTVAATPGTNAARTSATAGSAAKPASTSNAVAHTTTGGS
jgi:hypothetical protein